MAFTPDICLCVYDCLNEYRKRTDTLQSDDGQLFVSYVKPYKKVSHETIRHWLKHVMLLFGIDINLFKPHSTQAVSMSAATQAEQPIREILEVAGWKSDCTFAKFYNKPIRPTSDYANPILSI